MKKRMAEIDAPKRRRRKSGGNAVFIMLLIAALAVSIAVSALMREKYIKDSITRVRVTVEEKLSAIQELAAYEYRYSDFAIRENTRSLAGIEMPGTKNTIIIAYSGCIKAGFDFSGLDYTIDEENKKLAITLPEVKILDNYIDTDSIRTYEINNLFNPIEGEDIVGGLQEEKEIHLEKAREEGLYELAEEHAKEVIRTLFSVVSDYEVLFN